MAVFKQLSQSYIQRTFTHRALFQGVVPVYLNPLTGDVAVRNGVPDWTFDVVECIACTVSGLLRKVTRSHKPGGDFLITGAIQKTGK